MSEIYNASEIFEIGIDIEKNGRAFYLAAAQATDNPAVKKLCEELAVWEEQHVKIFEELKANLSIDAEMQPAYNPDEEYELYLKAIAGSHIFLVNRDVSELIKNNPTAYDLLSIALTFEKDSVVLYTAMLKMVPEALGKHDINKIIDEEIIHVSIISKQIDLIRG